MDLSTFYGLMATTCFTLVGLWWTVVERHKSWKTDLRRRRLAGGTYLSFLLPGLMASRRRAAVSDASRSPTARSARASR